MDGTAWQSPSGESLATGDGAGLSPEDADDP